MYTAITIPYAIPSETVSLPFSGRCTRRPPPLFTIIFVL
jgi:hypothetical protein